MCSSDLQHDPYSEYSRVYFPYDAPGFGFDATPPRIVPPPELQAVGEQFAGVHTRYTPSAMPRALFARLLNARLLAEQAWRYVLVALLLVGAAVAAPAVRLAWGSTLLLFAAYLSFAHPPGWGVYYIDVLPACDFLIAVGTVRVMEAAHQGGRTKAGGPGPAEAGHDVLAPRHAVAAVLCALAWLPFMVRDVVQARGRNAERARFHVRAEAALAPLAGQRAVVFVHYPAGHDFNKMITPHGPDLMAEPLWIVTDRGPRDQALLAAAGGRAAWDFDVAAGTLSPRATP